MRPQTVSHPTTCSSQPIAHPVAQTAVV